MNHKNTQNLIFLKPLKKIIKTKTSLATMTNNTQKKNHIFVSDLPRCKSSQLNLGISIPAMYINVENYSYDSEKKAVFYTIEVGIKKGAKVEIHTLTKRYSDIQKFDSKIRSSYSDSRYLFPFPPKKLFGNTKPSFLEKRASQLQKYLGNLVRVAGLSEAPSFRRFFEISDEYINNNF